MIELSERGHSSVGKRSVGTIRMAGRDNTFSKHFEPGDIALVDVADLDRKFANDIMLLQPSVVLNVQQSTTGRAPSLGAHELMLSGTALVDDLGSDAVNLHEGDQVFVVGGDVYRGETLVVSGTERTVSDVLSAGHRGRKRLGAQIRAFATASAEHFVCDESLILEGVGLPDLRGLLRQRTAMVVCSLPEEVSVAKLRQLAVDQNVVIIAVGATGVDAVRSLDLYPSIVVGDAGITNEDRLRSAQTTVLLRRPDGRAAGETHLREQSIPYVSVTTSLGELEVALLLAANSEASLIIESSRISNLETLVDSGGSAFNGVLFVRSQLAGMIVSVQAALKLDRPGMTGWLLVLMVIVAILAMVAAILFTPWGFSLWFNSAAPFFDASTTQLARL